MDKAVDYALYSRSKNLAVSLPGLEDSNWTNHIVAVFRLFLDVKDCSSCYIHYTGHPLTQVASDLHTYSLISFCISQVPVQDYIQMTSYKVLLVR